MARKRRVYTREFKLEAVKHVTEKGYSVSEAARSLGIGQTLLRAWTLKLEQEGNQSFPGHGKPGSMRRTVTRIVASVGIRCR
jgi:transposase